MNMAARTGSVHVATTKRFYKGKVYESHLLRRSFREGGKVKHETVGNLSHLPANVIDVVRRALRGDALIAADDALECVRSRPHGHVMAVLGTLRKLELDRILASKPSRERSLVVAMVAARIVEPGSKLAIGRGLSAETAETSLGEALGLGEVQDVGTLRT
jgi:hypothetical protein